ncbi:hypothetical protein LCGC14_2235610 [marine sediment metagenome]|uniref:Uncharacterized protein n=1 Tax=marine sediment metagenome TaxID=412755 RepID=A0A0F9DUI2_9ZZZZ
MARTFWNSSDPFTGVAVSAVTSDTIDVRDAFDVMISWRTISGLTSRVTLQMYVASAGVPEVFVEGRWSNWTMAWPYRRLTCSTGIERPASVGAVAFSDSANAGKL